MTPTFILSALYYIPSSAYDLYVPSHPNVYHVQLISPLISSLNLTHLLNCDSQLHIST